MIVLVNRPNMKHAYLQWSEEVCSLKLVLERDQATNFPTTNKALQFIKKYQLKTGMAAHNFSIIRR